MGEAKRERTGGIHGGCGIAAPWPGLPGCAQLTGALPRCLRCSPPSSSRDSLGNCSGSYCSLCPATPLAPSALSYPLLNCKTDQGGETVWKIPSTLQQAWKGAGRVGKKVGIFIWDFYYSGSNPPEGCIKPENGEVQDMWTHKLRQELRSMKQCLADIQLQMLSFNHKTRPETWAATNRQQQKLSCTCD